MAENILELLLEILKLAMASLGGGVVVKAADIAYQEHRTKSVKDDKAKEFVEAHLVPILKSADELSGKLRSLAVEDFRPLYHAKAQSPQRDTLSTLYLLAKFWAYVEIFREAGLTIDFVKDSRGLKLQNFVDCLESRPVRLLDRISQRAVGELMLERINGNTQPISFLEFIQRMKAGHDADEWIGPLKVHLERTRHTSERQKILAYSVVVQAMLDTLDPSNTITRRRPGISGKLTKKTWNNLNYKVFGVYLRDVKDRLKYLGPPKGRP